MTHSTRYDPSKKLGWKEIQIGAPAFVSSREYETGSWRSFRPVYSPAACINCGNCWISCPDNAIIWEPEKRTERGDKRPVISYNWTACKGCGVCAKVCPSSAISMHREEESE